MTSDPVPVDTVPPLSLLIPLSLQHLLAMFGATVLVPILLGVNPATILLFNGIGTLIFLILCQWKVPAYLGSSFAYLSPSLMIIGAYGYGAALCGYIASGVFFLLAALLIYLFGSGWVRVVLPDVVMGSIVAVIGLDLAPTAAKISGLSMDNPDLHVAGIALFTLFITILCMTVFKGVFRVIPIIIGIIAGSFIAALLGHFSPEPIIQAPWFAIPTFYVPVWSLHAVVIIIPASLVTLIELIGHLQVTGNIIGKDLMKDPGMVRMLLGKGISTILSGVFGSSPNTTYSENIGVLALTRVYSTVVFGGAAVCAILISFCGKFTAAILCIPQPVIGGITLLLFGVIAASGVRMLIESKVDLSLPKNLILVSVIFVIGASGAMIDLGLADLKGMSLATVVGVGLNLVFIAASRFRLYRDGLFRAE
ncbi:MAG TPA: uracil permease [Methanospirillum sp.]|nr:uracil permease [Methanospirillum sp.]